MSKEITEADFLNLATNCVGHGILPTGRQNFDLANRYAEQKVSELLNEVKAVRRFFRKGSPLTEMIDKIIEKYSMPLR